MKKNFIGIFFAIIAIIAVALIVLMLNYKKGISKPEISDAAKFKDEYVSLNDQTNSSNKTYPHVTISDNNKFHYGGIGYEWYINFRYITWNTRRP